MESLSNSRTASRVMCVIRQSEHTANSEPNGIYIGKTEMYALPVFLDQSNLVNPHIAVLGMTGSGKTYLLNSLIAHAPLYLDCDVTVFDWNGEYAKTVLDAGGTEYVPRPGATTMQGAPDLGPSAKRGRIACICLSALHAKEKEAVVREVLADIIEAMPRYKTDGKLRHIVFLDEAWKVVGGSEMANLFREGRKYGFAIVIATQMAGDIANEVIANSACMFVFKMQNSDDFSILRRSEVIADDDIARIAGLRVGACLLVEKRKQMHGEVSKIFIERVHGIDSYDYATLNGGKMRLDIKMEKFNSETEELCGDIAVRNRIAGFLESNSYNLDLKVFIAKLMELHFSRAEVVTYLRGLGVDDISIAEAYDEASRTPLADD